MRGVVRDRQGKPLSFVQVWCDGSREYAQETGDDGRFAFEKVALGPCTVTATLLGTPRLPRPPQCGPLPDVSRKVTPGDEDVVLVVDRGVEVVFRAPGVRFPAKDTVEAGDEVTVEEGGMRLRMKGVTVVTSPAMAHTATRLYVETAKGPLEYFAAVQDGELAFRRVNVGTPWQLFVAWTEVTKGTHFGRGDKLEAGLHVIALETGKRITGMAKLPPPPSGMRGHHRDRVVARRGLATVPGQLDWSSADPSGRFQLPPLPAGPWIVSVFAGSKEATAAAEAGDILTLEPR